MNEDEETGRRGTAASEPQGSSGQQGGVPGESQIRWGETSPADRKIKSQTGSPANPQDSIGVIHWFPGHMTKARRRITEDAKHVDAIVEILDARVPRSSANPDIAELTGGKPRLVVLNRADLADPAATAEWARALRGGGFGVLETDCKTGRGTEGFPGALRALLADKLERLRERGQAGKPLRCMVLGIPNSGKSSFINRAAKRKAARAADKPGVTRGRQWVSCGGGIELLDTPGILWPKLGDAETGEHLAFTGAIRDEVLDVEALGARLVMKLWDMYPLRLTERYKLRGGETPEFASALELIARRRGFLVSGGEADTLRAANIVLDEFRAGKLGRITLERFNVENLY